MESFLIRHGLGLLGFVLSNSAAWLIREVKQVELGAAGALVVMVLGFLVLRRLIGKRSCGMDFPPAP